MRSKAFASLAAAALTIVLGFSSEAFAQSQDSNQSENSHAESAPVTASNETTVTSGPRGENGGTANSQGDYNTNINQSNSASSDDAFAGSSATNASGNAKVQSNNKSSGATAIGSPVTSTNRINAHNGPLANGNNAQADHIGDGNMNINQIAQAVGGSPSAGSTFIDASGDSNLQANTACGDAITGADCGTATAGGVNVLNDFGNTAFLPSGAPAINGPAAYATGDAIATAELIGDTSLDVSMVARGFSGDADVGTLHLVGRDSSKIQAGIATTTGTATSGNVDARNTATAFVGGYASTTNGAVSVRQEGNAFGRLALEAVATSGDAVAGSLEVSGSGTSNVQADVDSDGDTAESGDSESSNDVLAFSGPVAINAFGTTRTADAELIGDSSFDISGVASSATGDAISGALFVGASGSGTAVQQGVDSFNNDALSGDACASLLCGGGNELFVVAGPQAVATTQTASASQEGDATVRAAQDVFAATGDAFAGSAHTLAGGGAKVQASSLVTNTAATSGNTTSGNTGTAFAGPAAFGFGVTSTSAAQIGNSLTLLSQVATASSGDALGGHMAIDASNGSDVQSSLKTGASAATSGPAVAGNDGFVVGGPLTGLDLFGNPVGGGTASQQGDNLASLTQDLNASSGDAISGSVDIFANPSKVQASNESFQDTASSGRACAAPICTGSVTTITAGVTTTAVVAGGQRARLVAGPVSYGAGNAVSDQQGDNAATWTQIGDAITGDSHAGSLGLDSRNSDVQASNKSNDSHADCTGSKCQATLAQEVRLIAGTTTSAGAGTTAEADQIGDNRASGTQRGIGESGDLFAGTLDAAATNAKVQVGNTSSNATATAGSATAFSGAGFNPFSPVDPLLVGTSASSVVTSSATATQQGDNALIFNGTVSAATGDAISGSLLSDDTGITYTAQIGNTSVDAGALSGSANAQSVNVGNVGARANDSNSLVNVIGDFGVGLSGNATASSGNAIAGTLLVNNGSITAFP